MKILLIRHGMTEGNRSRRYIGVTDEPLCPEGIQQLTELKLPYRPDRLFASPMLRCIQTAQTLFPGQEPVIITELKETNFGIFENRAWAGDLEHDLQYLAWLETRCEGPVPGGEDKTSFIRRCMTGFQKVLTQAKKAENIAIVAHGGTIMSILSRYADPPGEYYSWNPANGHGFLGEWDGSRIYSIREI